MKTNKPTIEIGTGDVTVGAKLQKTEEDVLPLDVLTWVVEHISNDWKQVRSEQRTDMLEVLKRHPEKIVFSIHTQRLIELGFENVSGEKKSRNVEGIPAGDVHKACKEVVEALKEKWSKELAEMP